MTFTESYMYDKVQEKLPDLSTEFLETVVKLLNSELDKRKREPISED